MLSKNIQPETQICRGMAGSFFRAVKSVLENLVAGESQKQFQKLHLWLRKKKGVLLGHREQWGKWTQNIQLERLPKDIWIDATFLPKQLAWGQTGNSKDMCKGLKTPGFKKKVCA